MANKHLQRQPKNVYDDKRGRLRMDEAWWYEDKAGIDVIHEIRVDGQCVRTDMLHIPWDRLRAAVARKDRK